MINQAPRKERLVDWMGEKTMKELVDFAKGSEFFGIQVSALTNEELLAMIGWLGKNSSMRYNP